MWLWHAYRQSETEEARAQAENDLVEHYLPDLRELCEILVNIRGRHRWLEPEEILGAAYEGLKQAIPRWDPERGTFWFFAYFRIQGAVLDYIRNLAEPKRTVIRDLNSGVMDFRIIKVGNPPSGDENPFDFEDTSDLAQHHLECKEALEHILDQLSDHDRGILGLVAAIDRCDLADRGGVLAVQEGCQGESWYYFARRQALRHAREMAERDGGNPLMSG